VDCPCARMVVADLDLDPDLALALALESGDHSDRLVAAGEVEARCQDGAHSWGWRCDWAGPAAADGAGVAVELARFEA
jgi:hypothetical protein